MPRRIQIRIKQPFILRQRQNLPNKSISLPPSISLEGEKKTYSLIITIRHPLWRQTVSRARRLSLLRGARIVATLRQRLHPRRLHPHRHPCRSLCVRRTGVESFSRGGQGRFAGSQTGGASEDGPSRVEGEHCA